MRGRHKCTCSLSEAMSSACETVTAHCVEVAEGDDTCT